MFVFGEVPEPNQETVNLVEDIVRSQIIELVRGNVDSYSVREIKGHCPRLCKPRACQRDAGSATSPRKTSYSSSDMTEGR